MNSVEKFIEEKQFYSFEGEKGLENLCVLAKHLGYHDSTYFGQISRNACIGDLLEYLKDNPGAMNAIVQTMIEYHGQETGETGETYE